MLCNCSEPPADQLRWEYVTPMTEVVADSSHDTAHAADALQAAYFRGVLTEHRSQLEAIIEQVCAQMRASEAVGDQGRVP